MLTAYKDNIIGYYFFFPLKCNFSKTENSTGTVGCTDNSRLQFWNQITLLFKHKSANLISSGFVRISHRNSFIWVTYCCILLLHKASCHIASRYAISPFFLLSAWIQVHQFQRNYSYGNAQIEVLFFAIWGLSKRIYCPSIHRFGSYLRVTFKSVQKNYAPCCALTFDYLKQEKLK